MAILQGPLVYLTDGAPDSLALFPEVSAFAQAIGSPTLLARVESSDYTDARPDPRFSAALASLDNPPEVVVVSQRRLGAGLAALSELRGATLALTPRRYGGLLRLLLGTQHERLLRETALSLLTLPNDGTIGTVRRVLFPADFAPRSLAAFDQAVALCQALAAELVVLHVYGNDRLPTAAADKERRMAAQSPLELFNIDKEQLVALVERAGQAGVRATSAIADGRAHAQILRHISANPIDMVVMPSHGPRTVEDILQGSTTIRVVQRAPVPVLVIRT
ncbi:MAG: universal stress protein [Roseiflexaceae bacterium]|nr:universal stress protein [Roseiflexaceae bacterium]